MNKIINHIAYTPHLIDLADLQENFFIYDCKRCHSLKRMTVHPIPTQTSIFECVLCARLCRF